MAYGDTITYEYSDGNEKRTLRLTYNANTYLIYKRFFDTDLLGDVLKLTKNSTALPKDIQSKIDSGELTVDNLDKANLDSMDVAMIDTTIMLQIIIAMIATQERLSGKHRGAEEIASDMSPSIITDADFMQRFTELILFGLKKKTGI